jgi:hypothetical protein
MTNSVQSVQVAQAHSQKEEAVQPPKNLQEQAAKQNAPVSQDQVTISQQAREALANKTNQ